MLAWIAVLGYFALTGGLAIRASRRPRSVTTHAIGARDLPAIVVGLSLAAQLASVATFVINPGLVYAYGLSALLGYGVAAGSGIMLGLAIFSSRFRRHGTRVAAITVPQWIGARFAAPGLRALFTVLSLGLITFATLIVVALALVPLLGIPHAAVVIGLLALVVSGVMIGGATGHAWINAAQAAVMLVVAMVMLFAGLPALSLAEMTDRLRAIDPSLLGVVNPASPLFRNWFEVFVCNFVVGLAIVCQPHVISKVLYLREDRDVRAYLASAITAGSVFTLVLATGFWARLTLAEPARIDTAIPMWISATFPPAVYVLVAIGLLCAGLSTLEGILLALSTTYSVDLVPMVTGPLSDRAALRAGRIGLVLTGIVTAALAIWQIDHPTGGTVALFAQYGVYLLFAASFVPLACGMFVPGAGPRLVSAAVVTVLVVYFGVALMKWTVFYNNPAFLATSAIGAGWLVIAAGRPWRPLINTATD